MFERVRRGPGSILSGSSACVTLVVALLLVGLKGPSGVEGGHVSVLDHLVGTYNEPDLTRCFNKLNGTRTLESCIERGQSKDVVEDPAATCGLMYNQTYCINEAACAHCDYDAAISMTAYFETRVPDLLKKSVCPSTVFNETVKYVHCQAKLTTPVGYTRRPTTVDPDLGVSSHGNKHTTTKASGMSSGVVVLIIVVVLIVIVALGVYCCLCSDDDISSGPSKKNPPPPPPPSSSNKAKQGSSKAASGKVLSSAGAGGKSAVAANSTTTGATKSKVGSSTGDAAPSATGSKANASPPQVKSSVSGASGASGTTGSQAGSSTGATKSLA